MDAEQLRNAVAERGARWEVGDEPVEAGLGYLPSEGVPPLEEQERIAAEFAQEGGALGAEGPAYARAHDWRNVDGRNFVTPIRDQSACGSCVAFGSSAAVESTLRIESDDPDLDVDLAEAYLFYCIAEEQQGRACHGQNGGWWPKEALKSYCDPGVPDEGCFPYTPGDQPCGACDDWQSRVTTIGDWTALQDPDEMKQWLSSRAPIVASMAVYEDFRHYQGGVYRYVDGPKLGGHCICLVGYDDSEGYWIGKNSWDTHWGEAGFFNIGYGECGIDSGALGVQDVRPPS